MTGAHQAITSAGAAALGEEIVLELDADARFARICAVQEPRAASSRPALARTAGER